MRQTDITKVSRSLETPGERQWKFFALVSFLVTDMGPSSSLEMFHRAWNGHVQLCR